MKAYKYLVFLFVFVVVTSWVQPSQVKANPGYEDFTTYTEVEPDNRIQKTAQHCDFHSYRNEDAHLRDDKGVGHFTDFEHKIDGIYATTEARWDLGFIWMLSNEVDDFVGLRTASKTAIGIDFQGDNDAGKFKIVVRETYGGNLYSGTPAFYLGNAETTYYFLIKKTGTSFLCGVYSTAGLRDAGDATDGDLANFSLTLQADHSFRYVFVANTWNDGNTYNAEYDIDNLDLQEAVGEYMEEFSESTTITTTLNLWKALSEKYLETITVTATSYGWREKASFYTETTTITEQLNKWIELRRFFTETITITETATFAMELLLEITEFTETIKVDASLFLWKAKQFMVEESINIVANFYDWIELKMTIVEFLETIEINALMDLTIAAPLTIEGVYALAALALIIAIATFALVVNKKD